ncbi:MAG: hypothetical protein II997_07215 [Clostridia bacterium]|nr:hypothetical protein [Clostridia bacterium]
MKKVISVLLMLCLLMAVSPMVFGAVAGQYYYTDIVTYLNGVEIDAINIGGETLISAEDMQYYSFHVRWLPDERELRVNSIPHAENGKPPAVVKADGVAGSIRGDYYETDIVTYLDDVPIIAYNVGGRTYLHAEEMRKYGYIVDWSPEKWSLFIVSPDRSGYVYDIPMSFGKANLEPDSGNAEVRYNNGKRTGRGDADYFDLSMSAGAKGEYSFRMAFYQNKSLFYSENLQKALDPLVSNGKGVENPCDPKEKFDLVNKTIKISVNGQQARQIAVERGGGNGHTDYYFTVYDLPRYKETEIDSITFSIGEATGEAYEIKQPVVDSYLLDMAVEKLKKNPLDFMKGSYATDGYFLIYMRESQSLGEVIDRLYLVDRYTGDVSEELLQQVKTGEGFNLDVLHPFAFSADENSGKIFFSCQGAEKTADFYVDVNTKTVYKR